MNPGLLLTETAIPSKAVGALLPLKSCVSHSRVVPARLKPVISRYDPEVKKLYPPNPAADCTLVIIGKLSGQACDESTRATIVPSPRVVIANGFAVPLLNP